MSLIFVWCCVTRLTILIKTLTTACYVWEKKNFVETISYYMVYDYWRVRHIDYEGTVTSIYVCSHCRYHHHRYRLRHRYDCVIDVCVLCEWFGDGVKRANLGQTTLYKTASKYIQFKQLNRRLMNISCRLTRSIYLYFSISLSLCFALTIPLNNIVLQKMFVFYPASSWQKCLCQQMKEIICFATWNES